MSAIITPIIMPFASARTSGTLPNVLPATTPSSPDNVANQSTGFPLLQAEPLGTPGAVPVNEAEMNGVLNYYTNILYQQGQGYQYTFDSTLSGNIGGYAQGCVLWCASNMTFQVSLVANNTANFVSNPSYINDGIHWQTANNYADNYLSSISGGEVNVSVNGGIGVGSTYFNVVLSGYINITLTAIDTFVNIPLSTLGLGTVFLASLGSMSRISVTSTNYVLGASVKVVSTGTDLQFAVYTETTPPSDIIQFGFSISFAASII